MIFEASDILCLLAELNSFARSDDTLSRIVSRYDDNELTEDDLSAVAAASRQPSPPPFMKKDSYR